MAEGTSLAKAYVQILPSMEGFKGKLEEGLGGSGAAAGKSSGASFGGAFAAAAGTAIKASAAAITAGVAGVSAFAKTAIETGEEFDSTMSQVAATMGLTAESIAENVNGAGDAYDMLRKKAKEMGAETNFTATQAAEGLNILAMSGYDAERSVDMIADVLHLAAAGSMDMSDAAGYISGAMKGFNDETKSSGYYADLMAKGATLANTSVSQLGDALSGAAAMGSAYSQSAEDMTISLLRLAEQGEVGSNAATMLSAAMANVYTPMDQAKQAMDELGVSAYDDLGAARDFNAVINDLSEAIERNAGGSEELANQYKDLIFGKQGLQAYNKLVVTGTEKQEEWAEALAGASTGAGEAAKQYDTMTDNLQGDIDIWNSALDGFRQTISDQITPTVREFVQLGTEGIGKITEGFESGGIEGAVEALGDFLGDMIGKINTYIPLLIETGSTLVASIAEGIAVNGQMLATAIVTSITKIAPRLFEAGKTIIEALGSAINDNLPYMLRVAMELVTALMDDIGDSLPKVLPQIAELIVDIADTLTSPENLTPMIQAALGIIKGLADGILEALPTLVRAVPQIISNIMTILTEKMPELLTAGQEILVSLIEGITENLPLLVQVAFDLIDSLVTFVLDNLPQLLELAAQLILALVQGITENLPKIAEGAGELIPKIIATVVDKLPEIIDTGFEITVELVKGILKALPKIVESVVQLIGSMCIKFTEYDWLSLGKNLILGIKDGVVQYAYELINAVTNAGKEAYNAVKDFFGIASPSKLMRDNIGAFLPAGIAAGITANENEVTDAMDDMAADVAGTKFDIPKLQGGGYQGNSTGAGGYLPEKQPALIQIVLPNGQLFAQWLEPDISAIQDRKVEIQMRGYAT